MITMLLFLVGAIGAGVAALFLYSRRRAQIESAAAALEASQPTEKEIDNAFRETEAPKRRQYAGGQYGTDAAGKPYVAGTDGALRRVAIVPTPDGVGAVMAVRKLDKAERKRRKRDRVGERSRMYRQIDGTLSRVRVGLLVRGADEELIAKVTPDHPDWHSLGRAILRAGHSAPAWPGINPPTQWPDDSQATAVS